MVLTNYSKLRLCVIGNISILIFVFILAIIFKDNSKYWNIGPNNDLYIVSIKVDSTIKYILLLIVIFIVNSCKTIIDSIGFSITNFNTYNPDKKVITEFTRNELQMSTNLMSLTRNIREIFLMMATISQVDIAIYSVLVIELSNIYTVRMILSNKKFSKKNESYFELIKIQNNESNTIHEEEDEEDDKVLV